MSWQQLTPKQAEAHPLYGLGGWLYALFAVIIFAVIADAVEIASYGEGSNRPQWLILLTLSAHLAVLWAGFTKRPWFPTVLIAVVWVTGALNQSFSQLATATVGTGEVDPHAFGVAGYLFISAALTFALLRSERVNVTYRHRSRASG